MMTRYGFWVAVALLVAVGDRSYTGPNHLADNPANNPTATLYERSPTATSWAPGIAWAEAAGATSPTAYWPSFRANAAQTGVAATTLAAQPRLRWKYDAKSKIEGAVAVYGDTAYAGTAGGSLVALSVVDGKLKWRFVAAGGIPGTPCARGNTVFVGDETGVFYAVNRATGKLRWKFKTEDKIVSSPNCGPGDNPTYVLFGSYDNSLYKLDARTGRKLWSFRAGAQVHCAPCVAGDRVIIAGCDGFVRIISLATGKQVAGVELGGNLGASPAYAAGIVYAASMDGAVAAVRVSDGRLIWQQKPSPDGSYYGSPAVHGKHLLLPSRDNTLLAVNAGSGVLRWTFDTRGANDSSPALVGNRAFFGSSDGSLYGVALETGAKVWQYRTGSISGGVSIAYQRLFVGTDTGQIYCFG